MGKHKAPALRNVDLRPDADIVKAYGHKGHFKSLDGIVHFYNTLNALTEYPATVPRQPSFLDLVRGGQDS